MMWHAWHRRVINAYFAGHLRPRGEVRMRARMESCASCRAHYERHLVTEAAMPGGDQRAADRLWAGIRAVAGEVGAPATVPAVATSAAPARWRWGSAWTPKRLAVGGAVLTAAALVIIAVPRRIPPASSEDAPATGLVARGAGAALVAPPVLHLFRSVSQHQAEALAPGAVMHSSDGLLFAYSNPVPTLTHLMVFAIDQTDAVHWYYPAYVRAGEDPQAVPIVAGAIGVELGEEIRHAPPVGALRVYGLFLPEPHRVLEIEALAAVLARAPGGAVAAEARFPLAGCAQTSVLLRVVP